MAYDDELAERVRALLATENDVAEQRMFGGLAFLLGGRMAVAVSGQGGLMARADVAEAERLLERPDVEPVVMRGRPMKGRLRARPEALEGEPALREWVDVERIRSRRRPARARAGPMRRRHWLPRRRSRPRRARRRPA